MQCQATLPLLLPLLPPPPLLLRLISHSHHASMIFFGVGVSRGASGVGLRPLVERSRADPQGAADIWCMDGDGAEQTQSSQIKSRTPQNGLLLRELEDARRRTSRCMRQQAKQHERTVLSIAAASGFWVSLDVIGFSLATSISDRGTSMP
jgi:hypothetical protein